MVKLMRSAAQCCAICVAFVSSFSACSKADHPVPSVIAPTATLSGLALTGLPLTAHVGDGFQLSAVAAYSDGSHQDITASVTWASTSPQVVTTSQSGLAKIVGPGEAEVLASYRAFEARAHVLASPTEAPQPFTIRGVIHENWPRERVLIENARIEVIGGPLGGQVFSGDPNGQFQLPPVAAPRFQLKFKKERYDDTSVDIVELPRDQVLDVALAPTFVLQHATIEGDFHAADCPPGGFGPGTPRTGCFREHSFLVRHPGQVLVESCTTHAFEDYIAWLRRGPTHVGGWIYCEVGRPYPQGWPVEAGDVYTFQVFGDEGAHYRATISYPN
jgi:hypothetical protein